ncbi:hypothetical protein ACMZOO_09775 [Catenovulum sp. SX2]|uniref:hypothetical protein n=1 Tax=Catenovulum sp. SX2 TaxID=3398614 RepID=UPI003F851E63
MKLTTSACNALLFGLVSMILGALVFKLVLSIGKFDDFELKNIISLITFPLFVFNGGVYFFILGCLQLAGKIHSYKEANQVERKQINLLSVKLMSPTIICAALFFVVNFDRFF